MPLYSRLIAIIHRGYFWKLLCLQLAFFLIAGIVLAIGDRSHIRVTLDNTVVESAGSITYSFSRPLDKPSFETAFKLLNDRGEKVQGVFGWSSRKVAYTPSEPLEQGKKYRIEMQSFKEKTGEMVEGESSTEVRVQDRGFVYVNSASQLHWYKPDSKRSKLISAPGEMVIATAVGSDGKVYYTYRQQRSDKNMGEQFFGLIMVSGENLEDRKVITGGASRYIDVLKVCGQNSAVIGLEHSKDGKNSITDTRLVYVRPNGQEDVLVGSDALSSSNELQCSSRSDQVAIIGKEGDVVVTSPYPVGERTSVGRYSAIESFSALGGWLITSRTNSAGYPVQRTLYGIDAGGNSRSITSAGVDAADGQVNPLDTFIALSEDHRALTSDEFSSRMQIVIRPMDAAKTDAIMVTSSAAQTSDEQPMWSPDGRRLTFLRINTSDGGSNRPQSVDGRLLDGEIQLVELPRLGDVLSDVKPSVRALGIYGGEVQWLP